MKAISYQSFLFLMIVVLVSCKKDSKTGIKGNNNDGNTVVIGNEVYVERDDPKEKSKDPKLEKAYFEIDTLENITDLRGWKYVEPKDLKTKKISPTVRHHNASIIKLDDRAITYSYRIASSSGIQPDITSRTHEYKITPVEEIIRENMQGWNVDFDISNEVKHHPITLNSQAIYWNTCQGEKTDWIATRILHATRVLKIKIIFPESKAYKGLRFSSYYASSEAKYNTFSNPDTSAVNNLELVWTIDLPRVDQVFRVDWDW